MVDVLSRMTPFSVTVDNSQMSVIANAFGEQYSEYMPWGYSGAYYYVRIGYDWGG